jgi:hypothetical protein
MGPTLSVHVDYRLQHISEYVIPSSRGHRGRRTHPHVSYLSFLRPPIASFTSILSASRSPFFLIGNDRVFCYKISKQRQIRRSPRAPLAEKSLTGAGRVRLDGENGPRCKPQTTFPPPIGQYLFFFFDPCRPATSPS